MVFKHDVGEVGPRRLIPNLIYRFARNLREKISEFSNYFFMTLDIHQ